jgi:hypothetical protein
VHVRTRSTSPSAIDDAPSSAHARPPVVVGYEGELLAQRGAMQSVELLDRIADVGVRRLVEWGPNPYTEGTRGYDENASSGFADHDRCPRA